MEESRTNDAVLQSYYCNTLYLWGHSHRIIIGTGRPNGLPQRKDHHEHYDRPSGSVYHHEERRNSRDISYVNIESITSTVSKKDTGVIIILTPHLRI